MDDAEVKQSQLEAVIAQVIAAAVPDVVNTAVEARYTQLGEDIAESITDEVQRMVAMGLAAQGFRPAEYAKLYAAVKNAQGEAG